MAKCGSCKEIQQQLLADGGCHEVECHHLTFNDDHLTIIDDYTDNNPAAATTTTTNTTMAVSSAIDSATASTTRKRKFPTLQEFAAAGEDRIKRKIAPIQKWNTLTVRDMYLVKRVVRMDVIIQNVKQIGYYAEMEDKNEQMVNVWLTEIIKTELEKYSLLMESVYIMPLGLKKSKETGYFYNDFIIQQL